MEHLFFNRALCYVLYLLPLSHAIFLTQLPYYWFHFFNEKISSKRLSDLPKVTKVNKMMTASQA